jgi:Lrp/AsnC family transcriptional regulator, regulator for asnA, asnC and gidA
VSNKRAVSRQEHAVFTPPGLDSIDEGIIAQLQQDGRRSYRDIARQLGLSESLVRWRTLRLLRKGTVRILAVTDPFQLGYQVLATVALSVEPATRREVTERLVKIPEVLYVASCAGRADLLIEVVCRDHEGLVQLLSDTLGSLPGVRATETYMELKIHKFSNTAPPSYLSQPAAARDYPARADQQPKKRKREP